MQCPERHRLAVVWILDIFNKLVSIVKYEAVVQEYLPVKSH